MPGRWLRGPGLAAEEGAALDMNLDLYAEARTLIAALDARQERAWAARFRECIEDGATGSEVVMALGWTAARYLEAGGRRGRCGSALRES